MGLKVQAHHPKEERGGELLVPWQAAGAFSPPACPPKLLLCHPVDRVCEDVTAPLYRR